MKFGNELHDTKPAVWVRVKRVKDLMLESAGTLIVSSFTQMPFLIKLSKSISEISTFLSILFGTVQGIQKPVSVRERKENR